MLYLSYEISSRNSDKVSSFLFMKDGKNRLNDTLWITLRRCQNLG